MIGRDKQTFCQDTTLLFGLTCWLYARLLLKITNAAEHDKDSSAVAFDKHQGGKSSEPAAMVQYPWEPTGTVTSATIDDTAWPPPHSKIHSISLPTRQDQQQQLEFLSNMTFANGGLRAPSCPCCQ
jgi:hypothetical protein